MIETGGPAFPRTSSGMQPDYAEAQRGMSIRDFFAGQALIGLVMSMGAAAGIGFKLAPDVLAGHCYVVADAMLHERRKP